MEKLEIRLRPEYTRTVAMEFLEYKIEEARDKERLQYSLRDCDMVQAQPRIPWSPPQKQPPRAELIWKETKAGNVRVGHFVCFKEFGADKRNFCNRPLLVTAKDVDWETDCIAFDFTYKKRAGWHVIDWDKPVYVVVACNPISQPLV